MDNDLLSRFLELYPGQPATAYWRSIEVLALLENWKPEGRGLDLGCGDGKLTQLIAENTGPLRMVGVDIDPLETAAAAATGIYESVHTTAGASIPCTDASFDYVLSNSVLEHIPNLESVIAETSRVLRPGGVFVFSVPTTGFRANLFGSLLPWTPRQAYLETVDRRVAHYHYLSRQEWSELLARWSMNIEFCYGYLDKFECQRWESMSRATGGLLYTLTGGRRRPIELQRALGLRSLQLKTRFPRAITKLFARLMTVGRSVRPRYWSAPEGLMDSEAGCLLIRARRV